MRFAFLTAALLSLGGCALVSPTPPLNGELDGYPAAYRAALTDFPGGQDVAPETLARFEAFLRNIGSADTHLRAAELYAEQLHFSDALLLATRRTQVVKHFKSIAEGGAEVDVDMLETLKKGADVYLIWHMRATFTPLRKTVESRTLGMTHLRFNDAGEVVIHQDFWDSGRGFYAHVPLLGAGVRAIGRRFTPDSP